MSPAQLVTDNVTGILGGGGSQLELTGAEGRSRLGRGRPHWTATRGSQFWVPSRSTWWSSDRSGANRRGRMLRQAAAGGGRTSTSWTADDAKIPREQCGGSARPSRAAGPPRQDGAVADPSGVAGWSARWFTRQTRARHRPGTRPGSACRTPKGRLAIVVLEKLLAPGAV